MADTRWYVCARRQNYTLPPLYNKRVSVKTADSLLIDYSSSQDISLEKQEK